MANVKVKRTRNRVYAESDRGGGRVVASPTEYAIYRGKQLLGRIVRMRDGWRCCRPTEHSKLGVAISPIGLNAYKLVRDWAIENLEVKRSDER